LTVDDPIQNGRDDARDIGDLDHRADADLDAISAVGHRLVNGGPKYREAPRVTSQLLVAFRDCLDRSAGRTRTGAAASGLLRHDFSLRHVASRQDCAHPPPVQFDRRGALRVSRLSYSFLMEESLGPVDARVAEGPRDSVASRESIAPDMVRGGTSWIPGGASPVDVRVIPTDEELMIATRGIRVLA
jgi:hypothetical protein